MIVVAILGILAAVAVPMFMAYVHDSKKGEAHQNLKALSDGALSYFQMERTDTTGTTSEHKLYPSGYKCTEGGANLDGSKSAPELTDWNHIVWDQLRFEITKPHYFKYCYRSHNVRKSFSARADAALGGDGERDTRFCVSADTGTELSAPREVDISEECGPGNP